MSRTEELLVLLLSRLVKMQARIEAFTAVSLKLQLGEDCKQHPLFNSFTKLEDDLLKSHIRSLSDQFPELRKLIEDHIHVSLDDMIEDLERQDG